MSTTVLDRKRSAIPGQGLLDGPSAKGTQDDRRLAFPRRQPHTLCDRRAAARSATPATLVHPRLLGWFTVALYSVTGGRFGLRSRDGRPLGHDATQDGGAPHAASSARSSSAIFEDGPDLVTMAMNGWADPDPAWWLNLQGSARTPASTCTGGSRAVHARAADMDERPRLWAKWADYDENLDAYAALRCTRETQVVILEPRPD